MQSPHQDPYGQDHPGGSGGAGERDWADEVVRARPLSALPSVRARALAFAAILVAGICGALIGWSFVDLQCHGSCTVPDGTGAVAGAVIAAGGVAVVAVLVLRAMGEWRTIKEERALAEATQAAVAGVSRTDTSGPEPDQTRAAGGDEADRAGGDPGPENPA